MLFDKTDLLRRLKGRVGRPESDEAFSVDSTDDKYYDCLTEAQDRLIQLLGTFVPDAVWAIPTLLTSSDSGLTYGFGNDLDGEAILAFGHFQVFAQLSDIPNAPLIEGVDFLVMGTKLRMPDNVPRIFSSGPYALYAAQSNVINSTHEPVVPKIARQALLADAEIRALQHLGLDSGVAEDKFDTAWAELLAVLKTQSAGKGGQPISRRPRSWLLGARR